MTVATSRRSFALTATAALLAALALASPGAVADAQAGVGTCTPASSWPSARPDLAADVVELVNQRRATRGLPSLTVSPGLAASAVWKARHMANHRYLMHNDPAPPAARTVGQRLRACGYDGAGWGENIAYGHRTPQAVMQAWLASPGHRSNIDNAGFRSIGVGAAVAANGAVYWTQNFGR